MTREEMEQVVKSGGSVLYKGRVIANIGELPTEADLATTEEERAAVTGGMEKQIADLQRQVAEMKKSAVTSEPGRRHS